MVTLLGQELNSRQKLFIELLNILIVDFLLFKLTLRLFECQNFDIFVPNFLIQLLNMRSQFNVLIELFLIRVNFLQF
jgi:hypothetical protein